MRQPTDGNSVASSDDKEQYSGKDTPARVMGLLDSEIAHLRSEHQRPGWTRWALIGGIASVIWLILSEIEQGLFETSSTMILFLVLSLLFHSALALLRLAKATHPLQSSGMRFQLTHSIFGQEQALFLLESLHSLSIVVISYLFRGLVAWPFTVTVCIIHGFESFMYLLGVLFSYLPAIPVRTPKGGRFGTAIGLIEFGANSIPASSYLSAIVLSARGIQVADIRLAGLFLALVYLLRILLRAGAEVPLLESFVAVRRQLALSQITVGDAIQQIDIALYGLQVADVWQKDIQDLLRQISSAHSELHDATQEAEAIQALVESTLKHEMDTKQALVMFASLYQSINMHFDKASTIMETFIQRS